jgi:cytochrome b-561
MAGESHQQYGEPKSLRQSIISGVGLSILVMNIFAIIAISLMSRWTVYYTSGFGWTNPGVRFNWHPFLMTLGFVVLYLNGVVIYRLLPGVSKIWLKIAHAFMNGTAGVLVATGGYAVWSGHVEAKYPNIYTLHSWIGLGTVTLFELNFLGGFLCFMVPKTPNSLRSLVLPYHVFAGYALLGLTITALMTGTQQKLGFTSFKPSSYSELPPLAMIINFFGIFSILAAIAAGFIITRPQWKRQPLPTD